MLCRHPLRIEAVEQPGSGIDDPRPAAVGIAPLIEHAR